jgi:hypothetical protein
MAFIGPIFIGLVIGMVEMSRLGMVTQLLTTAAREGCRTAVLPGAQLSDVQNRVTAVLAGSGITPDGTVQPTCPSPYTWNTAPGGTPITLSLNVNYSEVSWAGPPYFLKNAVISTSATLSSENP